jgi:transposase-like protein
MENEGESMPRSRKSYPPSLKARVAGEAIRGLKTAAQIAQDFAVHPNLVAGWKRQALDQLPAIFAAPASRRASDGETDHLYQEIGRLKVELDFLKKRAGFGERG